MDQHGRFRVEISKTHAFRRRRLAASLLATSQVNPVTKIDDLLSPGSGGLGIADGRMDSRVHTARNTRVRGRCRTAV